MNLIRIRMRMMRSSAERTAQIECSTLGGGSGGSWPSLLALGPLEVPVRGPGTDCKTLI